MDLIFSRNASSALNLSCKDEYGYQLICIWGSLKAKLTSKHGTTEIIGFISELEKMCFLSSAYAKL